jgi:hypothetical protein
VDDESPSRHYIVLALLAKGWTIICRVDGVVVTQFSPQRDREKNVNRRPDVDAAPELRRSGIPIDLRIGRAVGL